MDHAFTLRTGQLAIGDPTMGLARYPLSLPPGTYRLGPQAFRSVGQLSSAAPQALIKLDSPCVFALDEAYIEAFQAWYHRVGNECSYMALMIAERLPEFESAVGARIGFYWEHDVAGGNREGQYVLDPAQILNAD